MPRSRAQRKKYSDNIRHLFGILNGKDVDNYYKSPSKKSYNSRKRNRKRWLMIDNERYEEFRKGLLLPYTCSFHPLPAECHHWKCLQVRVSRNIDGTIRRHRVLISIESKHKDYSSIKEPKSYFGLMDVGNEMSSYFVVTALGANLVDDMIFEFPTMCIKALPNIITNDMDALSWANTQMRGTIYNKNAFDGIHPMFYSAICEFKKLAKIGKLPKILISSEAREYHEYSYLSTSPEGLVIITNMELSLRDSCDFVHRGCYEKVYFSSILPEIHQVLPTIKYGQVWDLETIDDFNCSGVGDITETNYEDKLSNNFLRKVNKSLRTTVKDLISSGDTNLWKYSAPELLRLEAKALLKGKSLGTTVTDLIPSGDTDLWKYSASEIFGRVEGLICGIIDDENIYNKFYRVINSDIYNEEYHKLFDNLVNEIRSVILNDVVEIGVIKLIANYAKCIKITEDMIRKLRVEHWFKHVINL